MNELVYAELVAARARAAVRLQRLEARHRETPAVDTTSTARLRLFRSITEARSQFESWDRVVNLAFRDGVVAVAAQDIADGDDVPGVPA